VCQREEISGEGSLFRLSLAVWHGAEVTRLASFVHRRRTAVAALGMLAHTPGDETMRLAQT
jgi:hypothetical protein